MTWQDGALGIKHDLNTHDTPKQVMRHPNKQINIYSIGLYLLIQVSTLEQMNYHFLFFIHIKLTVIIADAIYSFKLRKLSILMKSRDLPN